MLYVDIYNIYVYLGNTAILKNFQCWEKGGRIAILEFLRGGGYD